MKCGRLVECKTEAFRMQQAEAQDMVVMVRVAETETRGGIERQRSMDGLKFKINFKITMTNPLFCLSFNIR